jgi:hypothetical protein
MHHKFRIILDEIINKAADTVMYLWVVLCVLGLYLGAAWLAYILWFCAAELFNR